MNKNHTIHLERRKGHKARLRSVRVHKAPQSHLTTSIELCGDGNKAKPVTISGTNEEIRELLIDMLNKITN